jgi:phosphatidylcholine synthase
VNGTTIKAELEDVRPGQAALAWGVHALTASGAVIGTVALLAMFQGNLGRAGILILVALAIDSVDGTLARAARVSEVLPSFNGRRLDDMVDYLNYVIVPAVFLIQAGSLLSWHWAALPILASAYGFSQENAKTEDNFFLGFPSYWNVIALYAWLFDVSPGVGSAIVTLFSALVFVPLKYLYPSKMPRFRTGMTVLGVVWIVAMAFACLSPDLAGGWLAKLSLLYPALYLGLSFWLGGLHRAPR